MMKFHNLVVFNVEWPWDGDEGDRELRKKKSNSNLVIISIREWAYNSNISERQWCCLETFCYHNKQTSKRMNKHLSLIKLYSEMVQPSIQFLSLDLLRCRLIKSNQFIKTNSASLRNNNERAPRLETDD